MTIIAQNVRAARQRKGWSQEQLAAAAGISQTTIDKIERGETRNSRFLPKIATVLEVPLSELDPEVGTNTYVPPEKPEGRDVSSAGWGERASGMHIDRLDTPTRTTEPLHKTAPYKEQGRQLMPIYGAVEGGSGAITLTKDPVEYREKPVYLENVADAYGIYVRGESMEPRYRPGEIADIHPHKPPRPSDHVVLYRDSGDGDEAACIKLLVAMTDKEWTVMQYNPRKTYKLSRREWPRCHVVVGSHSAL